MKKLKFTYAEDNFEMCMLENKYLFQFEIKCLDFSVTQNFKDF